MDAPWDHYAYLSTYPTVASPEPGDVVVYPDGAAMYIGGGLVVMANHADGVVGTYPWTPSVPRWALRGPLVEPSNRQPLIRRRCRSIRRSVDLAGRSGDDTG